MVPSSLIPESINAGDVHEPAVCKDRKAHRWRTTDFRRRPWHVLRAAHQRGDEKEPGKSCCSSAVAFFKADVVATEESPHRTNAHRQATPAQLGLQFCQRHLRRLFDLFEEELGLRLDALRAPVAALRLGGEVAVLSPLP